jgi:hypothetical protein
MSDVKRISKVHLKCNASAGHGTVQVVELSPVIVYLGVAYTTRHHTKLSATGINLHYLHWDCPGTLPYKILVLGEHQTYIGPITKPIGSIDLQGLMYFVFEVQ